LVHASSRSIGSSVLTLGTALPPEKQPKKIYTAHEKKAHSPTQLKETVERDKFTKNMSKLHFHHFLSGTFLQCF
jgi:hypothetical protein